MPSASSGIHKPPKRKRGENAGEHFAFFKGALVVGECVRAASLPMFVQYTHNNTRLSPWYRCYRHRLEELVRLHPYCCGAMRDILWFCGAEGGTKHLMGTASYCSCGVGVGTHLPEPNRPQRSWLLP